MIRGVAESGDNAHQPSIAYVPYLLTGDRYYAEEMAFWANYAMMKTSPEAGVMYCCSTRVFVSGWSILK